MSQRKSNKTPEQIEAEKPEELKKILRKAGIPFKYVNGKFIIKYHPLTNLIY